MISENHGTPAFPAQTGMFNIPHSGMTLRDYFAAHALSAASKRYPDTTSIVLLAYEIADAMLEARK